MAPLTRHEPIIMLSTQNGYFPHVFMWRGQRLAVQAVVACHTRRRRHSEQHIFQVRTDVGNLVLAQDVRRNRWQVQPWHGSA